MAKNFRELLAELCAAIETPEQVNEAYDAIKIRYGMVKASAARKLGRELGVGARVQFEHSTHGTVRGSIEKVNRTTCSVLADDGLSWRVAASALSADDGKGETKGMSPVEASNVLLPADPAVCRLHLIKLADEQNSNYPQYKGHFDGYALCRIRRDIRTKMGLAFRRGEMAIYNPRGESNRTGTFFSAYSMSNRIGTHLAPGDFEPINTEREVARG